MPFNQKKSIIFGLICSMAISIFAPCGVAHAFNFDDLMDEFMIDDHYSRDASGARVANDINISASSGGNQARGGEVVEGKTQVETDIKTEINGRTVIDKHIEKETDTGKSGITVKNSIENGKAPTTVIYYEEDDPAAVTAANINPGTSAVDQQPEPVADAPAKTNDMGGQQPAPEPPSLIGRIWLGFLNGFKAAWNYLLI